MTIFRLIRKLPMLLTLREKHRGGVHSEVCFQAVSSHVTGIAKNLVDIIRATHLGIYIDRVRKDGFDGVDRVLSRVIGILTFLSRRQTPAMIPKRQFLVPSHVQSF
jgi:hypothetical protein